ncbi:MAG TPA: permease-like cell division protein FtsX [Micromonosporaceae bacterium]|jgi:cell division protein FtsX|nr:permease-like cell division protein FtsX [Micromonosporaceae bacterium]
MTIDDLIRAALDRAAAVAPDPQRIHANLAGRMRRFHRRRMLLAVAGGMAVVLAAAAGILGWHLRPAEYTLATRPIGCHVSIFFQPDATPEQIQGSGAGLARMPEVIQFAYESKNQAYENFKEMFKDAPDLVASVHPDTLPSAYRITVRDLAAARIVIARFQSSPGVSDVVEHDCRLRTR